MKVGIAVTDFSWTVPPERISAIVADIARRADEAGFDSLWTMDHLFQIHTTGLPPESGPRTIGAPGRLPRRRRDRVVRRRA